MSTLYNGDSANITTPVTKTIIGATNATPIVVTTSAAHTYGNNDRVVISGVTGNTAANGAWKITKLSSTTFSLNTSVGSGAYVSGGTVTDYSITPELTIPADGDVRSAASVNTAIDALADRTQFLMAMGPLRFDLLTASSGTWRTPPGVTMALVVCIGGGGGGGRGAPGRTTVNNWACGGGGGAGGGVSVTPVVVTPGTAHTYSIGAGGAGSTTNVRAIDGSPSLFSAVGTPAVARGGCGAQSAFAGTGYQGTSATVIQTMGGSGTSGAAGTSDDTMFGFGNGFGVEIRNEINTTTGVGTAGPSSLSFPRSAGSGGWGSVSNALTNLTAGRTGGNGLTGLAGGAGGFGGNPGTDSGTSVAGGGGGGGGGSVGQGAAGGAGGNGNAAGVGGTGAAGFAAAANTGGGGGGGGAGGVGTSTGPQGNGGNGGSGAVWIIYSGAQAVIT